MPSRPLINHRALRESRVLGCLILVAACGDLHVTAAGIQIKPTLTLGGWVPMKASGGVMAMGDLVLAGAGCVRCRHHSARAGSWVHGPRERRRLSGERSAGRNHSRRRLRGATVDGVGTAINLQPTGGGKAAITGNFIMIGSKVNAVVRALRESGIEVTSLRNHLLGEAPRLFFMHFRANDDVVKLARGLRAARDKTNSKRPTS
jgi:hypothetical protein